MRDYFPHFLPDFFLNYRPILTGRTTPERAHLPVLLLEK